MVANEGQHGERIAANLSDFVGDSSSSDFRTHDGSQEYTVVPVKALVYERNGAGAASAD